MDVPDPGHSFSVGERVLFEIGDDDFEGTVSKIVSSKMVWVEYVNADGRNDKRLYPTKLLISMDAASRVNIISSN